MSFRHLLLLALLIAFGVWQARANEKIKAPHQPALLIEPAETESKETLDAFVVSMKEILEEAYTQPEMVKGAPYNTPVRKLDDVKAARELDLAWKQP